MRDPRFPGRSTLVGTPILSAKLHLRHKQTNRQTKRQTDRRQESNSAHFSLNMWHPVAITFNDFPHTQLTKFRVLIGWSRIFYPPPLKFLWRIALRLSIGWTPLTDTTDKQTNKRKCLFVNLFGFSCLRWSLTLIACTRQTEVFVDRNKN